MKDKEPHTRIVRPLRGGQITIPAEFRRRLGITEDSILQMSLEEEELRLRPVQVAGRAKGSPWLKELYALFAPIREEGQRYTAEEIDQAIAGAVEASRSGQG